MRKQEQGEQRKERRGDRTPLQDVSNLKLEGWNAITTHKNKSQSADQGEQRQYTEWRLPPAPPDTRPGLHCYSPGHNPTIKLQSIGKPNPGKSTQFLNGTAQLWMQGDDSSSSKMPETFPNKNPYGKFFLKVCFHFLYALLQFQQNHTLELMYSNCLWQSFSKRCAKGEKNPTTAKFR